jgi:hypothetical protein
MAEAPDANPEDTVMSTTVFREFVVKQAALAWLESIGYAVLSGPDIAPRERGALPAQIWLW